MTTQINGSTALVTGSNRGIGRAITTALLERGAAKVYAAARRPEELSDLVEQYGDRVVPVELDVTDANQVKAAADKATDINILINNAGVAIGGGLTDENIVDTARTEMEINYFAPLRLLQNFIPAFSANGGGAIVNVSSIAGLSNFPFYPTYSASKAAVHSLTQAARALLPTQGITAHGVYPGPVDTDMAAEIEMDKATPDSVANAVLDGIEAGTEDIFPDPFAVEYGGQYHSAPKTFEHNLAAMIADA